MFISADDANNVIKRQRRASSLLLEEVLQGSLERECLEERCTEEEAREVFENDEMLVSILFSCVHNKNYCLGPLLSNTDPQPASFVSDSLHVKSLHFPPQQVESRCPQWSNWKCRGQLWHFCSSLLTMMCPAPYLAKVYGCCPILTMRRNTALASLRDEEERGDVGKEGSNAAASSRTYRQSLTWSVAASPLIQEALLLQLLKKQ